MDSTPIYTELQRELADPEANNWEPSAPPEFVAVLTDSAERSHSPTIEAEKAPRKDSPRRNGGRRHRAEH